METAVFAQPPGFSCTFTPQMGRSCGFRASPAMGIHGDPWGCMVLRQAQAAPQWWRPTCCCCGTCSGTVSPNKARAWEHPGKRREMGGELKSEHRGKLTGEVSKISKYSKTSKIGQEIPVGCCSICVVG